MSRLEEVQELIEQLGPADEAIATVAQTGDREWAVACDEATIRVEKPARSASEDQRSS